MNQHLRHWALVAATGIAIAGAASAVFAEDPVAVRSGGVGDDEIAELNRAAPDYSTKLLAVASGSGAYLAGVDVVVRRLPGRDLVLEHTTDGPILLAQLPPGRYEVTASVDEVREGARRTITRVIHVPASGRVEQVLPFDTGDEVGTRQR